MGGFRFLRSLALTTSITAAAAATTGKRGGMGCKVHWARYVAMYRTGTNGTHGIVDVATPPPCKIRYTLCMPWRIAEGGREGFPQVSGL